jgi:hypothetical protein
VHRCVALLGRTGDLIYSHREKKKRRGSRGTPKDSNEGLVSVEPRGCRLASLP